MADFLGKSKDLSKVTLELTFPTIGTHSFLEAKEINVSPSDNDKKGRSIRIRIET